MTMLEEYEGMESLDDIECSRQGLSETEKNYIEEILPLKDDDALANRIDEINGEVPPKAIDADKDIAETIKPFIDEINPIYLEAPSDCVQIEQAADAMENMEGLSYDEWIELTPEQRADVLQEVENTVSGIAHRPSCVINLCEDREGSYGYYSKSTHDITLNALYLRSDSFADYKECLDTIIHEGRHAYQDYNLTVRQVHSREGDITNWRINNDELQLGYQDYESYGMARYWMQPVESDARAFAEDVIKNYLKL